MVIPYRCRECGKVSFWYTEKAHDIFGCCIYCGAKADDKMDFEELTNLLERKNPK